MACCNEIHKNDTERVACMERKTLLSIANLANDLLKARRKLMAGLLAGENMDTLELDLQDKVRQLEIAVRTAQGMGVIV